MKFNSIVVQVFLYTFTFVNNIHQKFKKSPYYTKMGQSGNLHCDFINEIFIKS